VCSLGDSMTCLEYRLRQNVYTIVGCTRHTDLKQVHSPWLIPNYALYSSVRSVSQSHRERHLTKFGRWFLSRARSGNNAKIVDVQLIAVQTIDDYIQRIFSQLWAVQRLLSAQPCNTCVRKNVCV